MEPIHNRLPAILQEKDEAKWLDPNLKDTDRLTELLKPYPSEMMIAYEVSSIVNSPKNEISDCIRPVEGG